MRNFGLNQNQLAVMAILVLIGTGCSKPQQDQEAAIGRALIKPIIPAELSPQNYPPAGFVFSGFRSETLPEARYGVASPPIKPHAHILILSEVGRPSETYFSIMPGFLQSGMSVWIYEPAGQGGAGKFQSQEGQIDYGKGVNTNHALKSFISEVIKPDKDTPLYVMGIEDSGLWALSLKRSEITPLIRGIVVLDPHLSLLSNRAPFQKNVIPAMPLDQIAHLWQIYNPDLRLIQKSQQTIEKDNQRAKSLTVPLMGSLTLPGQNPPKLIWLTSKTKQVKPNVDLCKALGDCIMHPNTTDEAALAKAIEFMTSDSDNLND